MQNLAAVLYALMCFKTGPLQGALGEPAKAT